MKYARLALCFLIICSLCIPMFGCAEAEKLDLTMHASLLSGDGQVQQTFSLSISGPITHSDDGTTLDFMIRFPSEFGFTYDLPDQGKYTNMAAGIEKFDYYIWCGFLFANKSSDTIIAEFALSTEKEYLIVHWNDGEDHLLVASTDPNATVAEIQDYFSEFTALYAKL